MKAIATITAALALASCASTSTTSDAIASIEVPQVTVESAAPAATPADIGHPLEAVTLGQYAKIAVNTAVLALQSVFMPTLLPVVRDMEASELPEASSPLLQCETGTCPTDAGGAAASWEIRDVLAPVLTPPVDEFETCSIDERPSERESSIEDTVRRPSLPYRFFSLFAGNLLEDPDNAGELLSLGELVDRFFAWVEEVTPPEGFCGAAAMSRDESGL